MSSNATKLPRITWGTSFANTFTLKYQPDDWKSGSMPRAGSQTMETESGERDSWEIGRNYMLQFAWRWIATSDWDGTTGILSFLEWAALSNQFRFYPDSNVNSYILSYLLEPLDTTQHTIEPDGTRSIVIKLQNSTTRYDGY